MAINTLHHFTQQKHEPGKIRSICIRLSVVVLHKNLLLFKVQLVQQLLLPMRAMRSSKSFFNFLKSKAHRL